MKKICDFFKDLWKKVKEFFKKKRKPKVRISVLAILLFSLTSGISQRPNLSYVYVAFNQQGIHDVETYTVQWQYDSLSVTLYDGVLDVWYANTWVPYQSWMYVDSVKIQVTKPINYNTEYVFEVVAKNATAGSSSSPAKAYFIVSDVNSDHTVDGIDLIRLAGKWGRTGMQYRDWEDINGDGFVDGLDLIKLSSQWGLTYIP